MVISIARSMACLVVPIFRSDLEAQGEILHRRTGCRWSGGRGLGIVFGIVIRRRRNEPNFGIIRGGLSSSGFLSCAVQFFERAMVGALGSIYPSLETVESR